MLHKIVQQPDDLVQLVREGLPATSISVLAQKLDLGNTTLSLKLGIPLRTLTRRLSKGSRLTAAESDRKVRLARVFANAVELIGDEAKAAERLLTPTRALGGRRPLDQLDTDVGARMVEDILGRIAYGICLHSLDEVCRGRSFKRESVARFSHNAPSIQRGRFPRAAERLSVRDNFGNHFPFLCGSRESGKT